MPLSKMAAQPKICVLGAGISGLSTAVQIQNTGIDADITIIADKFLSETTSSAAAGIWNPHALSNTPKHLQKLWSDATFNHLRRLYMSTECASSGVTKISGYFLCKEETQFHDLFWKDTVENFRVLSSDDLQQFPGHKSGLFFTTFLSQPEKYLNFLTNKFKSRGGSMLKMKVNKIEELYGKFDVIVNCTGIYAQELNGDDQCEAIRGQVIKVRAPWVKHFYVKVAGDNYIMPGVDDVTLGGTHQSGRMDTNVDLKDKSDILKRTTQLLPSLKGAEILEDKVGIRPGRSSVRLEREVVWCGNKKIPVIHNYGHGGSGFTLHHGCSQEASRLVVDALKGLKTHSKL